MPNIFASAAKAEGYAKSRPPLHARIVEQIGVRAQSALDVGCGAGLSTAPLLKLAERVVGVDPVPEMVKWGGRVARGAAFLAGRAEALPFRDRTFRFDHGGGVAELCGAGRGVRASCAV